MWIVHKGNLICCRASSIRFCANSKYFGSISMPIKLRPVCTQATPVVPLPMNGSSTMPSFLTHWFTICFIWSNGLGHGCSPASLSFLFNVFAVFPICQSLFAVPSEYLALDRFLDRAHLMIFSITGTIEGIVKKLLRYYDAWMAPEDPALRLLLHPPFQHDNVRNNLIEFFYQRLWISR